MTLIPATNRPDLIAPIAASRVPINPFDIAIARMADQTGSVAVAYTPLRATDAGHFIDRVTGESSRNSYTIPPVIAQDPAFAGEPVFAPVAGVAGIVQTQHGKAKRSWSAAFIFQPVAGGATDLMTVFDSSSNTGCRIALDATTVRITTQVTGGGYTFTIPRTTVRDDGPNILIVSADSATRQITAWLNSTVAVVSPAGSNPGAWPEYENGAYRFFGYGGTAGSKVARFVGFTRAIGSSPATLVWVATLIDAAKRAYPAIVLV